MKTALITGATDGIGKSTALALAKQGWQIEGTGRSQHKADQVLAELKRLNPDSQHAFHCFDLADVQANRTFLEAFKRRHKTLDFLLLNANPLPKKGELNAQGYDPLFMTGFVSRYMFSIELDELLRQSDNSRVMHIAQIRSRGAVNFGKLKNRHLGGMRTMFYTYAASGFMAKYVGQLGLTSVPHLVLDPGTVDTGQVKAMGPILRFLAQLYDLVSPEELAGFIADHLQQIPAHQAAGQLFYRDQLKNMAGKLNDPASFNKLMAIGEELSGVRWQQ